MLITHHGHSEFLIETESGYRILTDPYDDRVGYPMREVPCDAVTVSHAHGDHAYTQKAAGAQVIAGTEALSPAPGVTVRGIQTFHDDAGGARRGGNIVFIIEADGLRLAHLGDLGAWDAPLATALRGVDILFVPVGGHYTIDASQADALCRAVAPRMVIPMHYRTAANAGWPIAPAEDYLRLAGASDAPRMPLLRVTRGDLAQQPRVCVLTEA